MLLILLWFRNLPTYWIEMDNIKPWLQTLVWIVARISTTHYSGLIDTPLQSTLLESKVQVISTSMLHFYFMEERSIDFTQFIMNFCPTNPNHGPWDNTTTSINFNTYSMLVASIWHHIAFSWPTIRYFCPSNFESWSIESNDRATIITHFKSVYRSFVATTINLMSNIKLIL